MRTSIAVARVELLRLLRSPTSFTLLLLVPALQILLFGYAIRPTSATVAVAVAGPSAAQADIARLARDARFELVAQNLRPGGARAMVEEGKASIGIELPTEPFAPVRAIIDASDPNLTAVAEQRVNAIYWHALAEQNQVADIGPRLHVERLFNPDARSDWAFLPALAGTIIMISMLMLGTLSMAREREIGTWETLAALPVSRTALLAGKTLPLALVGTAQGAIVIGLSVLMFDLPVRGSIAALLVLFPIFASAHLILGQALAARARTQLAALQGAIAFYLPAMLLSGFLYPFSTLPAWAQRLGNLFPLTHFIRAAREATLRGGDASAVLLQGVPIVIFLAIALLAALAQYRSKLD
ncbi:MULTISPECIES: ABC transporter permease [Sphingomonadaceae]|jgi:ABC-2 type transport system permease protein|uniref:ABC transporter permease n=1 Tax=Sphingomonadales TaxID=204457 RepID=UPI0012BB4590|nr:ABC transporter permease [Sphingobium sp. CAP-1]QGP77853.1 ABC transporter permease subunit [Sphingobium sp. CAP-1]